MTPHRAAFGPHSALAALRAAPPDWLELVDVSPISRAFAPMVRDGAFAVSEMAIATGLQALAYRRPVVLLPVVLAARTQEGALLCRADSALAGPEALAGARVGVRAYSQTTGMWLRGVLAERHGVAARDVRWVTFEDAHVAEHRDPPWAERAPPGADMLAMLRAGALDAVVVGNDAPDDPGLRTVFPDPAAAGRAFQAAYGFRPVNHIACVRADMAASHPDEVRALVAMLPPGGPDLGASVDAALRFMADQAMLPDHMPAMREIFGRIGI